MYIRMFVHFFFYLCANHPYTISSILQTRCFRLIHYYYPYLQIINPFKPTYLLSFLSISTHNQLTYPRLYRSSCLLSFCYSRLSMVWNYLFIHICTVIVLCIFAFAFYITNKSLVPSFHWSLMLLLPVSNLFILFITSHCSYLSFLIFLNLFLP